MGRVNLRRRSDPFQKVFGRKTFGRTERALSGRACDEHRGVSRLTFPLERRCTPPGGLSSAPATIQVVPSVVDKLFCAKMLVLRVERLA